MQSLWSGPFILIPNAEHYQQPNVDPTQESYPGVADIVKEMEYGQPEQRALRSVEQFDDVSMKASEEPANRSLRLSEVGIVTPQNQLPNLAKGRPIASAHRKPTRSTTSNLGRRQLRSRPCLKALWKGNRSNPYPSKEAVRELAAKENLTPDQVEGCLARRIKRTVDAYNSSSSMPSSDLTLRPNSSTCTNTQAETLSDLEIIHREDLPSLEERETPLSLAKKLGLASPIEQYEMTPPREECSTIQTPISVQNDGGPPRFIKRPTSHSNIRYSAVNEPTVSPHLTDRESETALGPNKSFYRTLSLHSSQDLSVLSGGKPTLPRRQKGRKVGPQKRFAPERQPQKIYQCTTCNFGNRYFSDWVRHLESHEPQKYWTCMLQGETVVVEGKLACPFCDEEPTQDHLTTHNVSRCAGTTQEKPTFARRDQLLGHMVRIHESKVSNPPDAWMTVVHEDPNQQFWCGFCDKFFRTTWDLRLKHLRSHFENDGLDMTKWVHERKSLPSLPDQFSRLGSPTHSVDHSRPTVSVKPTSGVDLLNSTPSMSLPLLDPGSPVGHPASTGPAPSIMSPAPPNNFMEIDPAYFPYLNGWDLSY